MFVSLEPYGAKRKTPRIFRVAMPRQGVLTMGVPVEPPAAAWGRKHFGVLRCAFLLRRSACRMTGGKRNVLLQWNHPGEEAVRYIPYKPVIAKREHLPAKRWNALHVIGDRRMAYTRQ